MRSVSVLARMHGVAMLSWTALFFTQALLVARHRVDLHVRLGIFGAVIALLVIVFGVAGMISRLAIGIFIMPALYKLVAREGDRLQV